MATQEISFVNHVADVVDFASILGLVKTKGSGVTQLSNVVKMPNCVELRLMVKLASGDLTVKVKNEADEVLDFSSGASSLAISDTDTHYLAVSLADIEKRFFGLELTNTAGYTIEEWELVMIAEVPEGRVYHVVSAGWSALPKDGVGCNFSNVLP